MVTTALAGNAGAALYGSLVGVDYAHALKIYYSKVGGITRFPRDLKDKNLGTIAVAL